MEPLTDLKAALAQWPGERILDLAAQAQACDVESALDREERTLHDLITLMSPAARPYLEPMAREAQRLTRWHFGRTINMYAPIYLSNACAADCLYCGFAAKSGKKERRVTLPPDAIRQECEALAERGFDNVLLLTGEAPHVATIEYMAESVSIAREYFSSVSAEVYALTLEEYTALVEAGLEGITLYMETFDQPTYARVHQAGRKQDYDHRLFALERAGNAGVRKLNLGALLGLYDHRVDGVHLALNAKYLQKRCWRSSIAISFPRLRHVPERFKVISPVGDADLVQFMLAMRLFLPEAGFTLSTRESSTFRDRLIQLGVTAMSAGSSTRPGGYATCGDETLEQFEIDDNRSVDAIVQAIMDAGYDPVWKDFDRAFLE